jgi:hypothetical protein
MSGALEFSAHALLEGLAATCGRVQLLRQVPVGAPVDRGSLDLMKAEPETPLSVEGLPHFSWTDTALRDPDRRLIPCRVPEGSSPNGGRQARAFGPLRPGPVPARPVVEPEPLDQLRTDIAEHEATPYAEMVVGGPYGHVRSTLATGIGAHTTRRSPVTSGTGEFSAWQATAGREPVVTPVDPAG